MYIDKNGLKWYKGNLHTHTKLSDGRLQPDEVTAIYRDGGYDFIALTDHWHWGEEYDADGLLVLSGCEYHTGGDVREGIYHIVSVGGGRPTLVRGESMPPVQEIIDEIKAAQGFAMLAHPAWSLNEPREVLKLSGLDALEIYNTVSGSPWNGRPYSGFAADRLAADGMMLGLAAVDDTHFYSGDACRSYVMVNADSLESDEILKALTERRYYSTQGPHFSHTLDGDILTVTSTPVCEIRFLSDIVYAADRITRGTKDGTITSAQYKIKRGETFVRYEVEDSRGNCGWSNIIKLDG